MMANQTDVIVVGAGLSGMYDMLLIVANFYVYQYLPVFYITFVTLCNLINNYNRVWLTDLLVFLLGSVNVFVFSVLY
jgi:hypothetical protein